jgi:hypothetical protein
VFQDICFEEVNHFFREVPICLTFLHLHMREVEASPFGFSNLFLIVVVVDVSITDVIWIVSPSFRPYWVV